MGTRWVHVVGRSARVACLGLIVASSAFASDPEEVELLRALGYVDSAPVQHQTQNLHGVTVHKADKAYPGLNLIADRKAKTLSLMDMEGTLLHVWASPIEEPVPLSYARLLEDGSILVLHKDHSLLRVRWDGSVMWALEARVHHELTLDGAGGFYTFLRREEVRPIGDSLHPTLTDHIAHYTLDGAFLKGMDLFEGYADLIDPEDLRRGDDWAESNGFWSHWNGPEMEPGGEFVSYGTPLDYCHANSITVLREDLPPLGERGDFLVSCRGLSRLLVFDSKTHERKWTWGDGDIQRQHHGTIVEGGNVLLFDNGTLERGYTRVVELDPQGGSYRVVYQGEPKESFFSSWGGSAQRLPNGNTLFCDTAHGHALEITDTGEVVWAFYSAFISKNNKRRKTLYRLDREVDPTTLANVYRLLADSATDLGLKNTALSQGEGGLDKGGKDDSQISSPVFSTFAW